MSSIFTKIIQGEIPCHRILENDQYLAFLDINPLREGHTLVIPKKEVDYIFDLDDDTLSGLHVFAKKVAKAIDKSVSCKRVAIAVLGLEVPHAHVHLIPMDDLSATDFSQPKLSPSQEDLAKMAEAIKQNL